MNQAEPRIGCVPYLNARPLLQGIHFPVRELVPAKLGEAFQSGEFDVALLSSIDVISNANPCAVDGISISSKGDVYSVVLLYEGDLKAISKVLLDPASHTSNALLQIVLGEFHGLKPEYVHYSDLKHSSPDVECPILLIGDRAIETRKRTSARGSVFMDLGGEWYRNTGIPFVFALWSLRDDITNKTYISECLRQSKDQGLPLRSEIASKNPDPEFALRYLTEFIHYDLGEEEKRGIKLFAEYLEKNKIIPKTNQISYY